MWNRPVPCPRCRLDTDAGSGGRQGMDHTPSSPWERTLRPTARQWSHTAHRIEGPHGPASSLLTPCSHRDGSTQKGSSPGVGSTAPRVMTGTWLRLSQRPAACDGHHAACLHLGEAWPESPGAGQLLWPVVPAPKVAHSLLQGHSAPLTTARPSLGPCPLLPPSQG